MSLTVKHGEFRDVYGARVVLEGQAFSSSDVLTLKRLRHEEGEDAPAHEEFDFHRRDLAALLELLTEALP